MVIKLSRRLEMRLSAGNLIIEVKITSLYL
jgi:hypothetical protein